MVASYLRQPAFCYGFQRNRTGGMMGEVRLTEIVPAGG
jgi:hypothetical protein